LTIGEDIQPVEDWYYQQSRETSTVIKRMQLRTESVVPYHQFIVIQTQPGDLEPGRAYRVDRGREREGWSVFDTIKRLGVPSRDTIAVLQQPVEELEKTSHCTIELHCSEDSNATLDLLLILGVCFRIHNNWGTRYNLITQNCYFFAWTIVNLCDNKLNKESSRLKSIWRRIFTTAYRFSAVLIWSLGYICAVGPLPLAPLGDMPALVLGLVLGILLVPILLLALLQIFVAWAVRDLVAHAVKWERQLEQELALGGLPQELALEGVPQELAPGGLPQELVLEGVPQELALEGVPQESVLEGVPQESVLEDVERLREPDIILGRIHRRAQIERQRHWKLSIRSPFLLLIFIAGLMVPSTLTFFLLLLSNQRYLRWGIALPHVIFGLLVMLVFLVVAPYFRWRSDRRLGGRPLDTDAEMGGVIRVDAPAESEQEPGMELATTRPAQGGNGWVSATTDADQVEAKVATKTATETRDNNLNQGGAELT
jgi:hypothetical protein